MRKKKYTIALSTMLVSILFTGCGANENIGDDVTRKTTQVIDSGIEQTTKKEMTTTEQDELYSTSNDETISDTENMTTNKVVDDETSMTTTTTEKVTTPKENTETTSKKENVTSKEETTTAKKETETTSKKEETTTAKKEPETTVHTHSYSSKLTKAATCQSTGVKTFTCSCGGSYTEDIAKTNHTSSDWIITKTATCQSTGTKVKKCTICNTELETATIEKSSDHTYVWTYVADGDYKVNICSGCGAESGNRAYNLGNGIYGYYDDAAAEELFVWVNKQRNSAHTVVRDEVTNEVIDVVNIPSLVWRDEEIAKKRALDIVTKFSHEGYLTDNENLAKGQGTAGDVLHDWCFSGTHRQTMLSIYYVYGSTACLWIDSDGNGTMYPYWTLVLSIQ